MMTFCYEDFAIWFPASWTAVGTIFTFLSLLIAYRIYRQANPVVTKLESNRLDLREALKDLPTGIRDKFPKDTIETNVERLMMVFAPRGGQSSETVRGFLQRLTTRVDRSGDLNAEILEELKGLRTDVRTQTLVHLEAVRLLKALTTEGVKIQREPSQPPSPTGDGSR